MSAAPWINERSTALPSPLSRNGKTRGSVSTAPRTAVLAMAARHLAAFAFVAGCTYGIVSLMGHSLATSAQKQRENAELRTEGARLDVLEIGRQSTGLVSVEILDRWAVVHGFDRPGGPVRQIDETPTEQIQG